MKKYRVKLLTQMGVVTLTVSEGDDMSALANEVRRTYGDFTTLSAEEIL